MAKPKKIGDLLPPVPLEMGRYHRQTGQTYCFAATCEGCPQNDNCRRTPTTLSVGPGVNIRKAFLPPPGYWTVAIDFSAVELRVAAQLSQDPFLLECYREDRDLHRAMAAAIFKKALDQVTDHERGLAKASNFGLIFGATPGTLAANANIPITQAVYIYNSWWARLAGYGHYVQKTYVEARRAGYLTNFFGRRRNIQRLIAAAEAGGQAIKSGKGNAEGFLKRTCYNTPIQSSAADLMRMAMVNVQAYIERHNLHEDVQVAMSIHDELDLYMRKELKTTLFPTPFALSRHLSSLMTPDLTKYGWTVPLACDIEFGDNWAEMTKINKLDPQQKPTSGPKTQVVSNQPRPEGVILHINTALTDNLQARISSAIATSRLGFDPEDPDQTPMITVPLKIKIGASYHRAMAPDGRSPLRIAEPVLRRLLRQIPGTELHDEV